MKHVKSWSYERRWEAWKKRDVERDKYETIWVHQEETKSGKQQEFSS